MLSEMNRQSFCGMYCTVRVRISILANILNLLDKNTVLIRASITSLSKQYVGNTLHSVVNLSCKVVLFLLIIVTASIAV